MKIFKILRFTHFLSFTSLTMTWRLEYDLIKLGLIPKSNKLG
jgi:hypothetical protein